MSSDEREHMSKIPTCPYNVADELCDHPDWEHATTVAQILAALDRNLRLYDRDGDVVVSVTEAVDEGEGAWEVRYRNAHDFERFVRGTYSIGDISTPEGRDQVANHDRSPTGYVLVPEAQPPTDEEVAEALAMIAESIKEQA